jgi:hypothetical protein
MNKSRWIAAIAFGGLVMGATALAAPPIAYKPGPAQLHAERSCRSQDVQPNSAAWELCLAHVTRAYEWGEPALAKQLARAAGQARESCLNEGQRVESDGFRECISREIDARSDLLILGDDDIGNNAAKTSE